MSAPKRVRARITFLPTAEGGRLTPAADGCRPHLQLGEIMTSCIVHSRPPGGMFELGQTYDVDLELVFWDDHADRLDSAPDIRLFEGHKLVATGSHQR